MNNKKLLAIFAFLLFISASSAFIVKANSSTKNETMNSLYSEPIKQESRILEGKTIVIDAGHGGKDVGAIGQTGIYEKDPALTTALNIERELAKRTGANVVLTREKDEFLTLKERVDISKSHSTDLFISIHYDGYKNSDVAGITTYFYKKEDQPLAKIVHDRLMTHNMDTEDRGVARGNYQVLRDNSSPSLLLELGFISNKEDEQRIQTQAFQTKAATAIVEGIIVYLTKEN